MQLLTTCRRAGDDGLQPLSRASSVDSQPLRRTLTPPVRLKRHVEDASKPAGEASRREAAPASA